MHNAHGKLKHWIVSKSENRSHKLSKQIQSILCAYVAKLQVHNIISSNKVISQVSFPRGLDKTSTKIIINLQLFGKSIKLEN